MAPTLKLPKVGNWLGVFSRSRADFTAEQCGYAAASTAWNQGTHQVVELWNNTALGLPLAILGVLAWIPSSPGLCAAYLLPNQINNVPGGPSMLAGAVPAIDGLVDTGADARIQIAPSLFSFIADGRTWQWRGGAPLAILHPGYALEVSLTLPAGIEQPNASAIVCSFLWTYWKIR